MTQTFSKQLETWLKDKKPKTLLSLSDVFAEKSFAIAFLLLLSIPALPIPTGGVTHLFEIIAMLLSLELIIGRRSIWLPKRWKNLKLGEKIQSKAIPFIIRRVRWFEKFSRPRMQQLIKHRMFRSAMGVAIFGLSLTAFFAPPFSGLDTFPALAVVIISLGLILEDIIVLIMGLLLGTASVVIVVGLGKILTTFVAHLLS